MSGDPKRLLNDPDTNEAVRQDLERALRAAPPPYDASKGLTRLLAVTAPAAAAGLGAATVVKGLKWAAYLKWSLGGGALLATAVVSTAAIVSISSSSSDAPMRAAPSAAPVPVRTPAPEVATPAVEDPSAPSASSYAPFSVSPSASSSVRAHPRAPAPDPTSTDPRVAREVALLGRARSALPSSPARALALADEGQREFSSGVLREEREAIAVLALVRLGRSAEANTRGAAFLDRYPHGPFSEKVRLALADRGRAGSAPP